MLVHRSSSLKLMILAFCVTLLFAAPPLLADSPNKRLKPNADTALISRESAAAIAKQGQQSKVLKIKKQSSPSGTVFKVKLLTQQGRVKQVNVNAATGEIEK